MGDAPAVVESGGLLFHRDLRAEHATGRSGNKWRTGLHSMSMGVHPRQIRKAEAYCAAMGVPTQFDERGQPILTSREHRRKHARIRGYVDYDAGYGDPM